MCSPFRYYSGGQLLLNGWQVGDGLVLVAVAALLVAIGVAGFARRDLAT